MLEEFTKAAVDKIIAQDYPYLKLPALLFATVSSAQMLGETFTLEKPVVYDEDAPRTFNAHIDAHWYEYTLTVVDRFGSVDENFPKFPGIRSRAQYKPGATVAVALAYGDSPVIIGEVQL